MGHCNHSLGPHTPYQQGRRRFLTLLSTGGMFVAFGARASEIADETPEWSKMPHAVAGVVIPTTALARKAVEFAQHAYPPFLFNHCMRTFLFGALHAGHMGIRYDAEPGFVASALHDIGLIRRFETPDTSFEIDGATRAEALVTAAHGSSAEARTVWNAIVAHDMHTAVAAHQSPEAMLVNLGAASDVVGYDPQMIDRHAAEEVIAAFPRLQFKRQFTALAVAHCERKPLSQRGTWLEGMCRNVAPNAGWPSTRQAIANAPFSE